MIKIKQIEGLPEALLKSFDGLTDTPEKPTPEAGKKAVFVYSGDTDAYEWLLLEESDIPPYPNDGKKYVLTELNGTLAWEEIAFAPGVSQGVTFPAEPSDWQRYYRTDVGRMFEFDANRRKWLSVQEFVSIFYANGPSGDTGTMSFLVIPFQTILSNIVITDVQWTNDDVNAAGTVFIRRFAALVHEMNVSGNSHHEKNLDIQFAGNGKLRVEFDLTGANAVHQIMEIRYREELT